MTASTPLLVASRQPTAGSTAGRALPAITVPEGSRFRPGRDRRDEHARDRLLQRVRGEFTEMPCLRLTGAQMARLFAIPEDVCARVIATLVDDGTLGRAADGRYAVRQSH